MTTCVQTKKKAKKAPTISLHVKSVRRVRPTFSIPNKWGSMTSLIHWGEKE